jgi:hypothetical protein
MADRDPLGVGLGLVGDVAAVASAVDFHDLPAPSFGPTMNHVIANREKAWAAGTAVAPPALERTR